MDPQQQMQQMLHTIGPMIFLFWGAAYVVKVTLYAIPTWQIAKKAGLSGPIALLCAIPLIGRLITLYVIAFSQWRVAPLAAYPPQYPPQPYPPMPSPYAQPVQTAPPAYEPPTPEPPTGV